MATHEERKQKIEAVETQLEELSQIDPQSLARTSELSPNINFKDAVPYFEEMLDLCTQLQQRDISRLTTQQLDAITKACQTISNHIKKVEGFTLNQNTPGDVCKNIISEISGAYDSVMNPLLLPLAFTATQATDYAKIEREAKGYHSTMKAEAEKLLTFISEAQNEAQNALFAVKEQAAEAGVSTNAQIFLKDSENHCSLASKWMKATIVCTIATFLAAVGGLITAFIYQPPDTGAAIQYVVAKLVVLSVLSFALFWSARNYKAQKHNEISNKHRANALMTFRAFVEGSSDERVKDAILIQASQAAFSSRSTGFDAIDNDAQTINPIVELIGRTSSSNNET